MITIESIDLNNKIIILTKNRNGSTDFDNILCVFMKDRQRLLRQLQVVDNILFTK